MRWRSSGKQVSESTWDCPSGAVLPTTAGNAIRLHSITLANLNGRNYARRLRGNESSRLTRCSQSIPILTHQENATIQAWQYLGCVIIPTCLCAVICAPEAASRELSFNLKSRVGRVSPRFNTFPTRPQIKQSHQPPYRHSLLQQPKYLPISQRPSLIYTPNQRLSLIANMLEARLEQAALLKKVSRTNSAPERASTTNNSIDTGGGCHQRPGARLQLRLQ